MLFRSAGHMGDKQRTQQNLEIVRTDVPRGLLFVKGSVPGAKNGWLLVRDSVKIPAPEGLPFPGAILEKKSSHPEHEEAPAGMVEAAAEHEVDTGPTTEEAAALLAEQHAGAPTDAEIEADAAPESSGDAATGTTGANSSKDGEA